MAQTVITKKPADRKPKAAAQPKSSHPNPMAIDLGLEDEGPQEFPVRFLRDDEVWYSAHLPKGTVAIALGQQMQNVDPNDLDASRQAIDKFVRLLFNQDEFDAISARLDDPDDRLDILHIQALIKRITERQSGLPTT